MKLTEEFNPIRNWAKEKGIFEKGDVKTQYIKFQEEAGEIAKAIMKDDYEEFVDGIGDVVVTLVSLAELGNKYFGVQGDLDHISLEKCINSAYNVIKNRTGKMKNGTFVKDEKPTKIAKKHKNGYYNLPCKHSEINNFLINTNIEIGGNLFTSENNLHQIAKPSRTGGVAYVYLKDIKNNLK